MMDQNLWRRHLLQAERAVLDGERHIARQRAIVDELERDGHDSTPARSLLETFVALQNEHIAHRNRLVEELSQAAGEVPVGRLH